MTCKPCEEQDHENCNDKRKVDPSSGVLNLGCVCQHREAEYLFDGNGTLLLAPKGVRKDVR